MSYDTKLAKRIDHINKGGYLDSSLHLARSCFASLFMDAYTQSQVEGVTQKDFSSSVTRIMEHASPQIFDAVDTNSHMPGKRQPSLRESLDATLDRFHMLYALEDIFGDSASTVLYGGSMKYGPFMNVRSGADSSDLDLIVVTDKDNPESVSWHRLMETPQLREEDKITLLARYALYNLLHETGQSDIMSQRFTVTDAAYTISTHIVPSKFIDTLYPQSQESLEAGDYHRYIHDYKERPFERPGVTNSDMNNGAHQIQVYNKAVKGGFIISNPAYSILDNRYIPGMYQNLVLPAASFAFNNDSELARRINNYEMFMKAREQQERDKHPGASLLNTDPRQSIIPADVRAILPT